MKRHSFALTIMVLITITGVSTSSAQTAPQSLSNGSPSREIRFTEEPATVATQSGTLYGTLTLPKSRSRVPVALIIAGSGPTDRDGNSVMLKGANNSLKLLAQGLAEHGIASLRYDKRGVGETGKAMLLAAEKTKTVLREEDLSFETYIDDAVQWGKQLQVDQRFSNLTVIGHSEGSLIGMVAAQRLRAEGFVSVAGAGRPLQKIILDQLRAQLPPDLLKTSEDILQQLVAGKTVASVPSELNALFRPSAQPYLISWLRYDPAKEIAKLHLPVLIVQGTTDLQTRLEDAQGLAEGNAAAKLRIIDGMNHVLKTVSNEQDKQVSSYSDSTLPVATDLIVALTDFMHRAKQSAK